MKLQAEGLAQNWPIPIHGNNWQLLQSFNRPVQLRITREQEFYIGSARSGIQGWIKIGVREMVRFGVDLAIVNDGGATGGSGNSSAQHVTVCLQPEQMRYRGISVYTNTTPREHSEGLGQNEWQRYLHQ